VSREDGKARANQEKDGDIRTPQQKFDSWVSGLDTLYAGDELPITDRSRGDSTLSGGDGGCSDSYNNAEK